MKKIAVFTSGGDSPGMNACIRAVVRTAIFNNIEVMGIKHGYDGMINNDFISLDAGSVSNIIQRGGTILKTARSQGFFTAEGRATALKNLKENNIDGVVAIGGDGTFQGASIFSEICDIPFIGCPGTIDNDLRGTDFTIGYDTALNTVVEAVDKIRDTAESHGRLFIVEVMGKDAGLIALRSGIGVGAESIIIPETKTDIKEIVKRLSECRPNKASKIVVVAEGDEAGGAFSIAEQIKKLMPNMDPRVCILGHLQRGGNPSAMDRVYSSRMGFAAVEALIAGRKNEMIGVVDREICYTTFKNAIKHQTELNSDLVRMMNILSI